MTAYRIHVIAAFALTEIIPSRANAILVTLVYYVRLKLMNVNQIHVSMVENVMILLAAIDVVAYLAHQDQIVRSM